MARSIESLKIREWASSVLALTIDPDDPSLTPPLVRADGWPISFATVGGDTPRLEVFNQIIRELSAGLIDLFTHGLSEWNAAQQFNHPVLCWKDTTLYYSLQSSLNEDPETATTYWAVAPLGVVAIAAALDAHLGSSDWRTGGTVNPGITSVISSVQMTGSGASVSSPLTIVSLGANLIAGVLEVGQIPDLPLSKVGITENDSAPTSSDGNDGDYWVEY